MKPTIAGILTVREVVSFENGNIGIRGYYMEGRTEDDRPVFKDVTLFVNGEQSKQLALALNQNDRIFFSGALGVRPYMRRDGTLDVSLTITRANFSVVARAEQAEQEPEQVVLPPVPQQQRVVEMSGTARVSSGVAVRQTARNSQPAKPAAKAATAATVQEVEELPVDDLEDYDPFAE